MRVLHLCGFVVAALALSTIVAGRAAAPLDGNEILTRAGTAKGLDSYTVPVHFDVHVHKPIGFRAGVDAIAFYKAPAQAGVTITRAPGLLKMFFKGFYSIDLAAQVWPSKYRVTSTAQSQLAGASVYVLQAVPKVAEPGVDHILFTVSQGDYSPLAASWYYTDGSTISLAIQNGRTSNYLLPQGATITVAMKSYSLDAKAVYAQYTLNGPVPTASP